MKGCEFASKHIDMGNFPKTYCDAMEAWTNCEEVGHCIATPKQKSNSKQMSLDFGDEVEDDE